MAVKQRDRETGEETGETRTFFRTMFVFFQEQLVPLPSGEPVPLEPPREPLTGNSHAHLLPRLRSFCESLGHVGVIRAARREGRRLCDRRKRRIAADPRISANVRLRRWCTTPRTRSGLTMSAIPANSRGAGGHVISDPVTVNVGTGGGLNLGDGRYPRGPAPEGCR
jgi:hypothetical protein